MRKIGAGINDEKYLEIYRDINGHRGEMGVERICRSAYRGRQISGEYTYVYRKLVPQA